LVQSHRFNEEFASLRANPRIMAALEEALRELDFTAPGQWVKPDGGLADPNLDYLRCILERALQSARMEQEVNTDALRGLVREVPDWIPDIRHPVIEALGRVERAI
jgi:hypothetical protein